MILIKKGVKIFSDLGYVFLHNGKRQIRISSKKFSNMINDSALIDVYFRLYPDFFEITDDQQKSEQSYDQANVTF